MRLEPPEPSGDETALGLDDEGRSHHRAHADIHRLGVEAVWVDVLLAEHIIEHDPRLQDDGSGTLAVR